MILGIYSVFGYLDPLGTGGHGVLYRDYIVGPTRVPCLAFWRARNIDRS